MTTGWAATALVLPPGEVCVAFAPGEESLQVRTLSKEFVSPCIAKLTQAHAQDVYPCLDDSIVSKTWSNT